MAGVYARYEPITIAGGGGGGGGGIVSINGDTTAAQVIAGGTGISVATASGTTTITATGSGEANTALSNLSAVAVNASLVPGTGGAVDLGTSSHYWNQLYVSQIHSNSGGGNILMHAGLITDASNDNSIDFLNRLLVDVAGDTAINWANRTLYDASVGSQLSWSTSGVFLNQLTANTALALSGSKTITSSTTTSTELGYVHGVTSSIQTQLNALAPSEHNAGNSSTALTVNFANGAAQVVTMTANCTFTFSNGVAGGAYVVRLVQGGSGSYTVTWPSSVVWPGGSAPTLSTTVGYVDLINFYYDGTYYRGSFALGYTT